jgi:ribosomal protein S2
MFIETLETQINKSSFLRAQSHGQGIPHHFNPITKFVIFTIHGKLHNLDLGSTTKNMRHASKIVKWILRNEVVIKKVSMKRSSC